MGKTRVDNLQKPELLAPAGNLEKMKIAFHFGADAVYFGLPDFSLRVRINQFQEKEIIEAAEYCHKIGKKFYVTLNIYAHNRHLKTLPKHLELIKKIEPSAVIVSDPGVFRILKEKASEIPIHISTQANVTNVEAVKFWQEQGAERIILAREVTLSEMAEMKKVLSEMELETFVHGAMCMSYSGRCILSKWMTGRSANLGDCAQPCRWRFKNNIGDRDGELKNIDDQPSLKLRHGNAKKEMSVVDDKERFQVDLEEDQHGTYFFNSYDMCLIEHMEDVMNSGVDSFKIEGRAKSVYYLAVVVRAYRKVIDVIWSYKNCKAKKKEIEKEIKKQKKELDKLAHRGYDTGFLLGNEPKHLFDQAAIENEWEFVGISKKNEENLKSKTRKVFVHNALKVGDKVEVVAKDKNIVSEVKLIKDEKGSIMESAHGGLGKTFEVTFASEIESVFLLRKRTE